MNVASSTSRNPKASGDVERYNPRRGRWDLPLQQRLQPLVVEARQPLQTFVVHLRQFGHLPGKAIQAGALQLGELGDLPAHGADCLAELPRLILTEIALRLQHLAATRVDGLAELALDPLAVAPEAVETRRKGRAAPEEDEDAGRRCCAWRSGRKSRRY